MPMLEDMMRAKDRPAVNKYEFATFKTSHPNASIFVMEGKGDKGVYSQWISRVKGDLNFECYPCNGKDNVIKLCDVLSRDKGNLIDNTYVFLDRDFDDSRGMILEEYVCMTDVYSIENYLINEELLIKTLKIDFDCHAHPDIIAGVVEQFNKDLIDFLEVTKDINRRLFFVRKKGIKPSKPITEQINKIASVNINNISAGSETAEQIIHLNGDICPVEFEKINEEFELLEPKGRYRGKFIYYFFVAWLAKLAEDRKSQDSVYFKDMIRECKIQHQSFNLELFAGRVSIPHKIKDFIMGVGFKAEVA